MKKGASGIELPAPAAPTPHQAQPPASSKCAKDGHPAPGLGSSRFWFTGRHFHQNVKDQIFVIHIPESEGVLSEFGSRDVALHHIIDISLILICETRAMSEFRLSYIDFLHLRCDDRSGSRNSRQDVEAGKRRDRQEYLYVGLPNTNTVRDAL